MRILTYKRTHTGDPNGAGEFGVNRCMGRMRNYYYDAVIGVGGVGREPKSCDIDSKINWVGINPKKRKRRGSDGVIVTFERFLLLDDEGPLLDTMAPNLAKRMYEGGARILLDGYTDIERTEAEAILSWSRQKRARKTGRSQVRTGCDVKSCAKSRVKKKC